MPKKDEYNALFKKKMRNVEPGENPISGKLASFWKDQIESVDKLNSSWLKQGTMVVRRYRDTRNKLEQDAIRRMNILWTNVKIMTPALYSKRPTPVVDRKFLDRDTKGRLSSQILERSLRNQVEINNLHGALKKAVQDYLLPGRGQIWVRYVPEIGQGDSIFTDYSEIDDDLERILGDEGEGNDSDLDKIPEEDEDDETGDEEEQLEQSDSQLLAEKAMVDYIDWKDFYMFPAKARTWEEVQAVGKRVYMSKEEAKERFGDEIGEEMRVDSTTSNTGAYKSSFQQAALLSELNERDIVVFEIWNKVDRKVYWISTGYDYLCDIKKDPYRLSNFFPCPEPISATLTNDTLIPVPDYIEWQDQAVQIDELTQRIAMLSKACKVAGTYDASSNGVKRLLNEAVDNELIPVDSWAMFAEKGGVKGCISLLPVKEIQEVIATLSEVRTKCKIDLDEVTGLSDVLRGTTDSRETLGGLRLKNNNAGTRLSDRQNEVARFARDTVFIAAEIMCNQFDDDTLIQSSGILFEDELQPDNVLAEFQTKLLEKYQEFAKKLPPPPPQMPPQMPPQGPPQPEGSNVVPFQPPQPGMPVMGGNGGPLMGAPQLPPIEMMMQQAMQAVKVEDLIDQKVKAAIKLLRGNLERSYRIDIETDSTIFADAMQERDDANEFIESVTKFIAQSAQLAQIEPAFTPVAGKMLQWAVRKFRTGRDLESAIDEFCTKMMKKAKEAENAPPPKSPEQEKAEAQVKIMQDQAEIDKQNDIRQAQIEEDRAKAQAIVQATNDQRDAQKQAAEDQRQAELNNQEMIRANEMHRIEMEKLNKQEEYNKLEHERKMEQLEFKHKEAMKPKPKTKVA